MRTTTNTYRKSISLVIFTQSFILCTLAFSENWESLYQKTFQLYKDQKYEDAVKVGTQMVNAAERAYGNDDPNLATSLRLMGIIYFTQRKYDDAEPYLERALDIDHPDKPDTISMLITIYEKQGKREKANDLNDMAYELWGWHNSGARSTHKATLQDKDTPKSSFLINQTPSPQQASYNETQRPKPLSPKLAHLLLYTYSDLNKMDRKQLDAYMNSFSYESYLFQRGVTAADLANLERIKAQHELIYSVNNTKLEQLKKEEVQLKKDANNRKLEWDRATKRLLIKN